MVFFSKKYTTTAGIAAGKESNEQFITEDDQGGNAPFDSITIVNEDVVTLQVNLDGNSSNSIRCLPGSIMSGTEKRFNNFTISNLDASTAHTAGKVHITVENNKFQRRD